MKFLCPNCKAKYQISDEKIAGRTLKMDCRRCSHPIVIRGERSGQHAPVREPSASRSSRTSTSTVSSSSGRRRTGSHVGPLPSRTNRNPLGAEFRKNPAGSAPPSRHTALDQWHVAINDVPVGPITREEISKKIAAGAVGSTSLAWREGFEDWRPLGDIPELSALLRRRSVPPPPKSAFPSPPRPLSRGVGSRSRAPGPRSSRSESSRPAARGGNVVPIGGRLGAAAAPDLEQQSEFDDEPTRVGTVDFPEGAQHARPSPPPEEAREQSVSFRGMPGALEDAGIKDGPEAEQALRDEAVDSSSSGRKKKKRKRRKSASSMAGDRSALSAAGPKAEAKEDEEPAPVVAAGPVAAAAAAPAAATAAPTAALASPHSTAAFPLSTPAASASSAGVVSAPAPEPRRGLPVGAWIAIAGAMAFGVALAVMVGGQLLAPPPAPVAVVDPTPPSASDQEPVEAEPVLPEPPPEPAVEDPPEDETPVEESDPAESTASRGSRGGSRAQHSPPSADEPAPPPSRGRRQVSERFRNMGADTSGGPTFDIGGGSLLDQQTSRSRAELTGEQISAVVARQRRTVQQCYETAARGSGTAPTIRLDVAITIGASGTVTRANARGQSFGGLTTCVERAVRRWRFPASRGPTQTSLPLVFAGQD